MSANVLDRNEIKADQPPSLHFSSNNITTFVFFRKSASLFGDPFHVRYSKLTFFIQLN